MSGRDHSEKCPKCGVWYGGFDGGPCSCEIAAADATAASVEAGSTSALRASAPEGYTLEMAYREGWFDSKDGDGQSCADAWSQSYAKVASESHLPYLARPTQADQGASGKSVPPPTTSGSPS